VLGIPTVAVGGSIDGAITITGGSNSDTVDFSAPQAWATQPHEQMGASSWYHPIAGSNGSAAEQLKQAIAEDLADALVTHLNTNFNASALDEDKIVFSNGSEQVFNASLGSYNGPTFVWNQNGAGNTLEGPNGSVRAYFLQWSSSSGWSRTNAQFGFSKTNAFSMAFSAPVPEPGTYFLLTLASLALGVRRRLRRRR
jgi:hypothetical protein